MSKISSGALRDLLRHRGGFVPAPLDLEEEALRGPKVIESLVDELYDRVVVRPIVAGSKFLWKVVDAGIVDGLVNAAGALSRVFGFVGSMFQTGAVNTYAFILTLATVLILWAVAL